MTPPNTPASEMVERMARAIAESLRDEFPAAMDQYDQMSGRAKARYYDMARAALQALSEPTEEMIEAGRDAANAVTETDFGADEDFRAIFRAMLTAARGEEPDQ